MAHCIPAWSKGGCQPVIKYDGGTSCAGPAGGTKTVGAPKFSLVVENQGDLIWRDEDYTVIQSDDDGSPFVFDNV